MMTDREKIIAVLQNEKAFNLISHMQPDGDSVGSLLSMGKGLQSLGKTVQMFIPGFIPNRYTFLEGTDKVNAELGQFDTTATTITLDSSDEDRLDYFKETVMNSKKVINIDHHVTNQRFGHYNLVDGEAAATGEIVYRLLLELKVEITAAIAESIYVAIATDTGSFKYENTTSATHRVIASLLEHGVNPSRLAQKIFDDHPLPFYTLLKEAISSLEINREKGLAIMTLSRDIRERSGARPDQLEGIVNYSRNLEGVELGILFYVDGPREVKVGFRSKTIDVSVLAEKFNGGGHSRAAGCRIYENFETAKRKVLHEVEAMLQ